MIDRQQLAQVINNLVVNYKGIISIERFYRKLNRLIKNIAKYCNEEIFVELKTTIKYIHKYMMAGDYDETIVNDCIYILRKISISLLVFK